MPKNNKCFKHNGYVHRGSVSLFYRYRGPLPLDALKNKNTGPVFVLIHGDDSNSTVWHCQQKYFCSQLPTLAMDMRGFGKSSKFPGPLTAEVHANDLRFLLENLSIQGPIYLLGWSIGGTVVQRYTLDYPSQVAKLLLVDTAPQIVNRGKFQVGRTPLEQVEILATIANDFPKYIIKGTAAAVPEQCPGADKVRAYIAGMIAKTGPCTAFRQTLAGTTFSVVKELGNIHQPTLILFGGQDKVISPDAALFLRQYIPNSSIYEFPEAGHAPFLTFADTFNAVVAQFLADAYPCQICL